MMLFNFLKCLSLAVLIIWKFKGILSNEFLSKGLLENMTIYLKIVNPVVIIQTKEKHTFTSIPCIKKTELNVLNTDIESYQWKLNDNLPILNDKRFSVDQTNGDLYINEQVKNLICYCEVIDIKKKQHKFVHTILTAYPASVEIFYAIGLFWKSPCYLMDFVGISLKKLVPKIWALITETIRSSTSHTMEESTPEEYIFQDGIMEDKDKHIEKVCRTGFNLKLFSGDLLAKKLDEFDCPNLECFKSLLFEYLNIDKQRELFADRNFIERMSNIQLSMLPELVVNFTVIYINPVGTCIEGYVYFNELICVPCPPGTYQIIEYDKFGLPKSICKSCNGHTFSSMFGKNYCNKCNPEYVLNSEKTACFRKDIEQVKKISKHELVKLINESEEVYYDLGSLPAEEGLITKVLMKRSSSMVLIVLINIITFTIMIASVAAYFVSRRKAKTNSKSEKLGGNDLKLITAMARSQSNR